MRASLVTCIVLFASIPALAEPPKVTKTTPDNGAKDVDSSLKEIRVTFDQPMQEGGFSWVGGGPTFPKLTGKAHWVDDKTCVLPVQVEPEHEYWLSVNNPTFGNFRSKMGESAEPYPISFTTAAAKDGPKFTAEQNRAAIAALRKSIDENYAHRDLKKLDWDKLFKDHAAEMESAKTPMQFARAAASLLAPAKDTHVWLKVNDQMVPSTQRTYDGNWNSQILQQRTGMQQKSDGVWTGKIDGIQYIVISQWSNAEDLEPAFAALGEAVNAGDQKLIVDIRSNGGGNDTYAMQLAGCFVDSAKTFSRCRTRSDGNWSAMIDRMFEPNPGRPRFKGKVAVLIGRGDMSSSEDFALMMRQVPDCKLIGATTGGSSGNPRANDLGNGVEAWLATWEEFQLDGTTVEGVGVKPDIEVQGKFENADPVLDTALLYLK